VLHRMQRRLRKAPRIRKLASTSCACVTLLLDFRCGRGHPSRLRL